MNEERPELPGKTGGDELVDLMKKPEAMLNSALSSFAKNGAASFWASFKRHLSTASEPLLRKDMGERYLSSDAFGGGLVIWLLATLAALVWPEIRSAVPIICEPSGWFGLERVFNPLLSHGISTILVGGALVFFHTRFGLQSFVQIARYRAAGTAYHTQSRGLPRWGENNGLMSIIITALLLLFDFPAGVLFVASVAMSSKLSAEQQVAIHSRYLDALDQRIEQEYLEDAILGNCPTEITQLHKPLSSALNADLRKNIAAAAVGKPVAIYSAPGKLDRWFRW